MALKDLGEKGIVDPYPPLVDIKGELRDEPLEMTVKTGVNHVLQGWYNIHYTLFSDQAADTQDTQRVKAHG